jgi:Fic family protein
MLYRWHKMLMNGRRDIDDIGFYRQHTEPMQIVSGADYAHKVHYEAPPSERVLEEMEKFVVWFNNSFSGETALLPLARSALTHLWFESIHPFEDGNGRIGRALSEKVLSQYQENAMVTGIATVILRRKKAYYAALEKTNTSLDITEWMLLFASMVIEAQRRTHALVSFTIEKSKLMHKISGTINERQEKAIMRMFAEGIDGFKGGLSAANYTTITSATPATVTRDLGDLVDKEVLIKTGEKKGTRYYLNIEVQDIPTVLIEDII